MMTRRTIRVVGAMLESTPGSGRYLLTQRSQAASLPLLWEFPGGRCHDGEPAADGLQRELRERLGLSVTVHEQAMHTVHSYPAYDIDFTVFRCALSSPGQQVNGARINAHQWASLDEMEQYPFPDADAKTLEKLLDL
jgi:8-oxo-dGTP diphosphatase